MQQQFPTHAVAADCASRQRDTRERRNKKKKNQKQMKLNSKRTLQEIGRREIRRKKNESDGKKTKIECREKPRASSENSWPAKSERVKRNIL